MGHYVAWAPTCVNMVYELEGNLLDGPLLHSISEKLRSDRLHAWLKVT